LLPACCSAWRRPASHRVASRLVGWGSRFGCSRQWCSSLEKTRKKRAQNGSDPTNEALRKRKSRAKLADLGGEKEEPPRYSGDSPASPDETYLEASRRKEIAVANLKELELAEKKGRMVDAQDAARAWNEVAGKVQMSMLAIPDRIGRECEGLSAREIREKLNTEIRRALMVVAEEVRRVA
jgi:hypothetical protein